MPSDTVVLHLEHVSKSFPLYKRSIHRLLELFSNRRYGQEHHALKDISFELRAGEALGILGQNGAGKSTLLKIIMGVSLPDEGEVIRNGSITGLLELGSGFDPALSGLENIRQQAILLGQSEAAIEHILPQVIEFAELADFIDMPVRTYSSGMMMRLGFAVAIHTQPRCLVIDEALAVGDARFQQKCIQAIRTFKESGGAILFVSHDLNAVKLICDRALVLDQGALLADETPEKAVQIYYQLLASMDHRDSVGEQAYGHQEVRIVSVHMQDEHDQVIHQLASGAQASFKLKIQSQKTAKYSVGMLIRDRFGQDIFGINTSQLNQLVEFVAGQELEVIFSVALKLAPGKYSLTLAIHSDVTHHDDCQHWLDHALSFEILGFSGPAFSGVCELPVHCMVTSATHNG